MNKEYHSTAKISCRAYILSVETVVMCASIFVFLRTYNNARRVCVLLSHVLLFVTPWTVPHQAPLFIGFPGKNTELGCHFFLQGVSLTQGFEPPSLVSPALAGRFFTNCTNWEVQVHF